MILWIKNLFKMIPKKLFYYWESNRHAYIDYCIKTIDKRCGVECHFITPGNVHGYLKDTGLVNNWRKICPISQRIDILRIALLHKYGGLWLDCDTIMLKDMNSTFDNLKEADITAMRWRRTGRTLNGYFFAQKESKFLGLCLEWINQQLCANPNKTHYAEHQGVWFGEHMFGQMHYENNKYMNFIDPEIFLPIQFPFNQEIWWQHLPIEQYLKPETICIGLNHSQYPENVRNMPMKQILHGKNLFSNIFKYSESLGSVI